MKGKTPASHNMMKQMKKAAGEKPESKKAEKSESKAVKAAEKKAGIK
jgi:hypothetical protein